MLADTRDAAIEAARAAVPAMKYEPEETDFSEQTIKDYDLTGGRARWILIAGARRLLFAF